MKVRKNIRDYMALQFLPHLQSSVHFKACILQFALSSAIHFIVIQIGVICSFAFHPYSFGW